MRSFSDEDTFGVAVLLLLADTPQVFCDLVEVVFSLTCVSLLVLRWLVCLLVSVKARTDTVVFDSRGESLCLLSVTSNL